MICLSEKWDTENPISNDSNFQRENYTALHQVSKKIWQRGRVKHVCAQRKLLKATYRSIHKFQ